MLNKIKCCTKREIIDNFENIRAVVDFLRQPGQDQINIVECARKMDRKSDDYRQIKINQLPAISINFNFKNSYIKGDNVDQPTGYLYLDIDGYTEHDIDINKTYVCAYWRSLSNTGLTLVVKVNGLTPANLKIATEVIASSLDVPYDDNAVSIDRLTVLSYDPNAYYNDNTEVFPIDDLLPEDFAENFEKENQKRSHFNEIKNFSTRCDYNGTKLRFDNLDEILSQYEIDFDENGIYDFGSDNKISYAKVFPPFRTMEQGSREVRMKSIAYQLVTLNKKADRQLITDFLQRINKKKFFPCLEQQEIDGILNRIYRNIDNKYPINNDTRRFIYDKTKNLTSADKRRYNLQKIHTGRIEKTKAELLDCMTEWNAVETSKLTIKKLANYCGKNRKTVQKYYRELLDRYKA